MFISQGMSLIRDISLNFFLTDLFPCFF
jgi:hypothetical protein